MDDLRTRVKIFGERNTGSNLLESLVELNLDCKVVRSNLPNVLKGGIRLLRVINLSSNLILDERFRDYCYLHLFRGRLGWKHRMLPDTSSHCDLPKDVHYLLTVRDPLAWLSAMYRRPHNLCINTRKIGFSDFLRMPCRTMKRECVEFGAYQNPVQMWNLKVRAMTRFASFRESSVVRHEDVVVDPALVTRKLARAIGVGCVSQIVVPLDSIKRDGQQRQDFVSAVLDREWLSSYSDADFAFVMSQLDSQLTETYGYS